MNLSTLRKLVFERHIVSFLRLSGQAKPLYRCAFATAAGSSGVLALLADGPREAPDIARELRLEAGQLSALEAWLACGVQAGELALRRGRYRLKGSLSRLLARPRNRVNASLFEEVARYHYDAILQAPSRLRGHRAYTLDDQDGELIATSSRILEPFVEEAVDWAFDDFPGRAPRSVLEVGCGAGHYLRYMARRAPNLALTAIDRQPAVVALAQRNLQHWGLADRVALRLADLFDLPPEPRHELVTLHNSIYYFSEAQRDALLARLRALLAPGGRLLLTTSCRGGSPAVAALHLWWSLSDVAAGLPERDGLRAQLEAHGFSRVRVRQLVPGESYHGFLAQA